ncbi:MAG: efflux RND transporter periplasmic adaptor subunit [Nannocystaceae bacterium]|nr:efflux RND transporter periplasmic adaptor subunit [Nannocystaceae bacterium]
MTTTLRSRIVLLALCFTGACGDAAPSPAAASVAATTPRPAASDPLVEAQPGWVAVIMPAKSADVAPQFEGELAQLAVVVGQQVREGEALARFDTAAATEALAIARADLQAARGAAAQAAAAARGARHRYRTEQTLAAQGYAAAASVVDAAAESGRTGGATASAAGQVAAARARVEQLERRLRDTALTAPFAGEVAVVYREQGALAGPGQPVVRLIDTSAMLVRFAVSPAEAAALPEGTPIEVVVDWLPQALSAHVRRVAPQVDAPTGLVFLEAELAGLGELDVPPRAAAWVRRAA